MNTRWVIGTLMAVVWAWALPCAAQRVTPEDLEQNPYLGGWFVQTSDGQITDIEAQPSFSFLPEGRAVYQIEGEPRVSYEYAYEADGQTLTLTDPENEQDIWAVIHYSLQDRVMVFRVDYGGDASTRVRMELTRNRAGVSRHMITRFTPSVEGLTEDWYLGRWHIQTMNEELIPSDQEFYFHFPSADRLHVNNGGGTGRNDIRYNHDEARMRGTELGTDVRWIMHFRLEGDLLIVLADMNADGTHYNRLELTRNPEGNRRHRQMREQGRFIPPDDFGVQQTPPQAAGNPNATQEAPAIDPAPVRGDLSTIEGTWFLQRRGDELIEPDGESRIEFTPDGLMVGHKPGAEPESANYAHDQDRAMITIYSIDEQGRALLRGLVRYRFDAGMLVLELHYVGLDEFRIIELTRNPEGTQQHQRQRADQTPDE